MYKIVKGTRATHTPGDGEVVIDESTNVLYVGDGATQGGVALQTQRQSPATLTHYVLTSDGSTAIPLTYDVISLVGGSSGTDYKEFTLADGSEGQRIYLCVASGAHPSIRIWDSSVYIGSNANGGGTGADPWQPFTVASGNAFSMIVLVYVNNRWNVSSAI